MRASKDDRKFGYAGEPGVQEELPLVLEAGKIDLLVSFKSRSSIPDIFDWFHPHSRREVSS